MATSGTTSAATSAAVSERVISLGPSLAAIPERLLLAHARGEVLFIAGAGISRPSGLPDFRDLVVKVYARLDSAAHAVISTVPSSACNAWTCDCTGLSAICELFMFVEAVALIEQLLVPFECWSMSDFGFFDGVEGRTKLSSVDNADKAASLLRLLDLTIGRTDGSVVPNDLGDVLNQVEKVAPGLVNSQTFRRLATLARRA